ncbi:MAG: MBL fold metallo-hydrolase [Rhodothermales bacterium]|nr:MBL fold metallo-hydrolase [Rhodothermales bacterium]
MRILCLVALLFAAPAAAQQDFSAVEIETVPVADGVFMLVGAGGNVGLFTGADGAFLIDDQYAPLTEKLAAAVAAQTDAPVRFVVNTHWHGDHTGGNEAWGERGALLVAHENVRERMSTDQFLAAFDTTVPAAPEGALPVVTFTDAVTFHWNGDEVRVFHVHHAHTDGDAVIHLAGADVLHAGDTYFNGMYPFIDVSSGGSLDGMIAAADTLLALAGPDTRIIPGHGPLSGRAELEAYRDLLGAARDRIGALIAEGRSREEVVAAQPMAEFDAAWGGGFMAPDRWTGIVYDALAAADAP